MMPWNHVRTFLVAGAFMATLGVVARMLVTPGPLERPLPEVVFPETAPLTGWQMASVHRSSRTTATTATYRSSEAGFPVELEMQFIPSLPEHYVRDLQLEQRFVPRGNLPLDAALHFFVNSRGKVIPNRRTDRPNDAVVDTRDGDFGIWEADQRLHLSTIITPDGHQAITPRGVVSRFYRQLFDVAQLSRWLFHRAVLPDHRSVLVHFSMPANALRGAEARRTLEDSWSEWRQAALPVFPAAQPN